MLSFPSDQFLSILSTCSPLPAYVTSLSILFSFMYSNWIVFPRMTTKTFSAKVACLLSTHRSFVYLHLFIKKLALYSIRAKLSHSHHSQLQTGSGQGTSFFLFVDALLCWRESVFEEEVEEDNYCADRIPNCSCARERDLGRFVIVPLVNY